MSKIKKIFFIRNPIQNKNLLEINMKIYYDFDF